MNNMVDRVATEMRRQCGKRTDDPWELLERRAKDRWRKRATAVLGVIQAASILPSDDGENK